MTAQALDPAGARASGGVADLLGRTRDSLAEVSHRYGEAAARRRCARASRAARAAAPRAPTAPSVAARSRPRGTRCRPIATLPRSARSRASPDLGEGTS